MYSKTDFDECRDNPLSKFVGPMTIGVFMAMPGGAREMDNPTTVVGLLDAGVILLYTNKLTPAEIKQVLQEQIDRVDFLVQRTEEVKAKAKNKIEELRAKHAAAQQRIGTEVPDSELGPAPQLAIEPAAQPTTETPAVVAGLGLGDVEWPKRES